MNNRFKISLKFSFFQSLLFIVLYFLIERYGAKEIRPLKNYGILFVLIFITHFIVWYFYQWKTMKKDDAGRAE